MARPKKPVVAQETPVNLRGTWDIKPEMDPWDLAPPVVMLVVAILLMVLPAYWIATMPDPPKIRYQDNIIVSKGFYEGIEGEVVEKVKDGYVIRVLGSDKQITVDENEVRKK